MHRPVPAGLDRDANSMIDAPRRRASDGAPCFLGEDQERVDPGDVAPRQQAAVHGAPDGVKDDLVEVDALSATEGRAAWIALIAAAIVSPSTCTHPDSWDSP